MKMPVEGQRKRFKMLLVEGNSICNFACKSGMFYVLSLDLCYLQIFATITKKYGVNLHAIFLGFDVFLVLCTSCEKSARGYFDLSYVVRNGGHIFTSAIKVFLGIEMADAGTHRIKIANLCRFCGKTAPSSKHVCKT